MTTTIADVVAGIGEVLESAGWRTYLYPLDNPSPPCAVVYPQAGNFETAMGLGTDEWTFIVDVMWPTNSDRAAWDQAYAAMDASGFRTELAANPRVNNSGCDVAVTGVEVGQSADEELPRYLNARFTLRVLIDG
jgi:hypothetical protein